MPAGLGPSIAFRSLTVPLTDVAVQIKAALSTNDAATSDAAGSAYVENFALDVFTKADNEDRAGRANRDTARAFQAAANFLELLGLFTGEGGGGMSEEVSTASGVTRIQS